MPTSTITTADAGATAGLLADLARAPELAPMPRLDRGDRLGRFEVLAELGRGGFGVVYEARDTELGRRVTLKVLSRVPDATKLALFRREAQTVARLNHPNIVTLFDHGSSVDGRPYLVLERLHGVTLAARLATAPPPLREAIEIAAQIARGVQHAHAAGVVHRDLKPHNVFLTDDGQVKVLDFGLSRVRDALEPDAGTIAGGTLPYMSPEQRRGDPDDERTDVFALGVVVFELVTGRPPEEAPSLVDVPPSLAPLIARMLARDPAERPASVRDAVDAIARAIDRPAADGDPAPFRWLDAFGEEDAAWFFGRDREAARLERVVSAHALVGVIGPSGAGKSSLVRAGLVPRLRRGEVPWTVITLRPGAHPLGALRDRLHDGLSPDAASHLPADASALASKPGLVGEALRAHGGRVLLVIDQLEELYTHATDREARLAFAAALLAAVDDGDAGRVRIVVTIREDFLGRVTEAGELFAALSPGLVPLGPPGPEALGEALTAPVERAGYHLEPGVADEIVAALAGEKAPLPLLQLAASRLWEDRDVDRRRIGRAALDRAGGVAGLLAAHANEVLAALPAAGDRAIARRLLCGLVTSERTRRVVPAHELIERGGGEAARVLEHLVASRLVTASRGDAGEWLELAHESLLEHWGELRRWLDEDAQAVALREELAKAAAYWAAQGRPRALLWSGRHLDGARALRDRPGLTETEQVFLAASRTRALRRRRRRIALQVGVPLVAVAVTLGAIAEGRAYRADAERAQRRAAIARAGQIDPLAGSLAVIELARDDESGGLTALAQRLAAQRVPRLRWTETSRGDVSNIAFAPDGVTFVLSDSEVGAIVGRVDGAEPPRVVRAGSRIFFAALTPDGATLVTAARDGTVTTSRADGTAPHVWKGEDLDDAVLTPDGRRILLHGGDGRVELRPIVDGAIGAPILEGRQTRHSGDRHNRGYVPFGRVSDLAADGSVAVTGDGFGVVTLWRDGVAARSWRLDSAVLDVHVSPDATRIDAVLADGGVYVWSALTTSEPHRVGGHRGQAVGGVFSPDGTRFLTTSIDGTAQIWRSDGTGAPVVLHGGGGGMDAAVFSPDGRRVATLSGDELRLWTTERGGFQSLGPARHASALQLSPDGRTLVAAGAEGIAVFAVDGEIDPIVIGEHGQLPRVVRFSRDGRRVITCANDGTVWSWSIDGTAPARRLAAHGDMCFQMVLSPDGTRVVTAYLDHAVEIVRSDGEGAPISLPHPALVGDNIVFEPGGTTLLTAAYDGTLRRWGIDGSGGAVIIDRRRDHPQGAGLSPDGSRFGVLLGAPVDSTLPFWSTRAPAAAPQILKLHGHPWDGAFSADSARLAYGFEDGTLRIWDLDRPGNPRVLRGHTGAINEVAWDPAQEHVVTASDDGTARVWRVDGRGAPVVLRGHTKAIEFATFSPDGRLVATASQDGTARIWRADGRGDPVVLRGHFGGVAVAVFSPDGRRVITTSEDRTVRAWRYRLDDLVDFLGERTRACPTDAERRELEGVAWREADERCRRAGDRGAE